MAGSDAPGEPGPETEPTEEAPAAADQADGGAGGHGAKTKAGLAALTLGALGVVFGGISTSPLYAFRETFEGHHIPVDEANVIGVCSLILWSLILVVSTVQNLLEHRGVIDTVGEPDPFAAMTFAATKRCPCGAGLAYDDTCVEGPWRGPSYWDCSAVLAGTADPNVTHTARLPFAFYEIKDEGQPSARGATTRPDSGSSRG